MKGFALHLEWINYKNTPQSCDSYSRDEFGGRCKSSIAKT